MGPSAVHPSSVFKDALFESLCSRAWDRLPAIVRTGLAHFLWEISDTEQWSLEEKELILSAGFGRNPAWYRPYCKDIRVCVEDCRGASENTVMGAFVHEVAHAYQELLTPEDRAKCEWAGDSLPISWGFAKEIKELDGYRRKFCTL